MLSLTSCWLAGLKNKACSFSHNPSRLIGSSGSDIFPKLEFCRVKSLYCSFFCLTSDFNYLNPDFRGAPWRRTAAQFGCHHIVRMQTYSRIRTNVDNSCSMVLPESLLSDFANFDFASHRMTHVEIPYSHSTHAAWAYSTLTRHVK